MCRWITDCSWQTRIPVVLAIAIGVMLVRSTFAIEPKPAIENAQWAGQTWGELIVSPALVKSGNSVMARAVVRGGPAGDPQWKCSQYSGWVAAGTTSIAIVIPDEWSFTSGEGFVRSIGGRAIALESDAGDPPPFGWEDRLSDTCYCTIETFGASGGCETREVTPMFASALQQEILPSGPSGEWLRVTAEFSGWNGVSHWDVATGYVMVIDETDDLEDNDDDGIADAWEIAHFGDLSTASRISSYPDGDSVDDLTEFQRWDSNTLDGEGNPYDPTAKNTAGGSSSNWSSGPACGAAAPSAVAMCLLGMTMLSSARRRRR